MIPRNGSPSEEGEPFETVAETLRTPLGKKSLTPLAGGRTLPLIILSLFDSRSRPRITAVVALQGFAPMTRRKRSSASRRRVLLGVELLEARVMPSTVEFTNPNWPPIVGLTSHLSIGLES
jgi:hypothetical protein